jgi:hypothetical protein
MKVHRIFAAIKDQLYAVSYDENEKDALVKAIEDWGDVAYLTDFFELHLKDLQSGFYGPITVERAVLKTIDEAEDLFDELYRLAEDEHAILNVLFKPLDDREYRSYEFQKHKAYGLTTKSWLRLYAIRWDSAFVITGSAIKLTHSMQEREHTLLELRKLEMVRNFLKEGQDEGEFVYLDL